MTTNMTPLEDAIQDRDLPEIQRILSSAPAPSQDELDMALEMAVESDHQGGYTDALEPLLAAGANITESAFVGASHRDDNLVYQAFLDHGWDINSMEFGQPALRLATNNVDRVKWLLSQGADPNLRGSGRGNTATPLATAAYYGDIPVLEALLSGGSDLIPEALVSAMHTRAHGSIPVMNFLINRGVNVNAFRKKEGDTPLHWAVRIRDIEKVKLLLESGADGTIKDVLGLTAAEVAKEIGRMDLYEILSRYEP